MIAGVSERHTQGAVTYYVDLVYLLHFSKPLFFHLQNPPKLAGSPKEMYGFLHKELSTGKEAGLQD